MRGIRVSRVRAIGLSAYFLGFSIYSIYTSFVLGVPAFFAAAYLVIFSAAAYFSYGYSKSHISFWKKHDGSIWTKGGTVVMIFYIAALVSRIVLSFVVGGASEFYASPFEQNAKQAAPDAILAASIVDGLLVAGAGLLIGRNVALLRRFNRITNGKETVQEL